MNKKSLLIELHFLPCMEYICLLQHHKNINLEACESYVKGSYRNKAKIVTANGLQTLSIPLKKGKHQQKNIRDVSISEVDNWRTQHWRSMKTAYQRAPYWDDYEDDIKSLCMNSTSNLWQYSLHWLTGLIDILALDINLKETESYQIEAKDTIDLRHKILPKLNTWYSDKVRTIEYEQVFADRQTFIPNSCILDLLFCKGPESILILEDMII